MRGFGVLLSRVTVACAAVAVHAAPSSESTSATQASDGSTGTAVLASVSALRTGTGLGSLRLPAIIPGQEDAIRLAESAGGAVTLRITPFDEAGAPVDGGRVIVLRPGERRTVHLTAVLPFEDLVGRRLVVETLSGAGVAEIEATWLSAAEAEAAAAASATMHIPRRHLPEGTPTTSEELIDQAETAGSLSHETAVLYRVYAIFGDARLPAAYRGDDADVFESLYLSTVVSEWATYSAATQAALKPFLMPPAYRGSWNTAASPGATLGIAHALDFPQPCDGTDISPDWAFKENANGKVRVWYDTAANDDAVAAFLATTADTKIWPGFTAFMTGHEPLSDSGASCDGGSGRLDVYLTDVARAFTEGHAGCSNSSAFITLNRANDASVLAHEMFHAFQFSFQVGGCLTNDRYRWWTEGSATWAEQYLYPFDQLALNQGFRLVRFPERAMDSVVADIDRVYGTFLVPFYVQNRYGSPDFVRVGWEKCKDLDAIHAVDAAIPGGFAQIWHEVALRDFNIKPVDEYKNWRSLITYHANPQVNVTLDSGYGPQTEFSLLMNLAHLSATYKNFFFSGTEISTVAFFNGATQNLQKMDAPGYGPLWNPQAADPEKVKGVKVQAIIKIEGQDARVEDWTDKPYVTFCRDAIAERLQQLTIVISNARLDDTGGNAAPTGLAPVLWVSNMGCWKWKGSTHYNAQGQVAASEVADSSDVTWTRTSATHPPPEITYQATGHLSITAGARCSGSGTVSITSASSSLTTYNYTPADSVAARAYVGSSLEFNSIPVTCQGKAGSMMGGFWFNVPTAAPPNPPMFKLGADGKTLSGQFHDPTNGLDWTWNLTAQRE